ncbi:MAG: hypothetical protein U5J95_02800 [Balneolaceae bacterium]|nr:hypothetical protein [Balneolaceae bacterium]
MNTESLSKIITYSLIYIFVPLVPKVANTQNITSIKFKNNSIIGDHPSKPIEYSLGRPFDVSVDSRDNIYIADQGTMTIKVFNKKVSTYVVLEAEGGVLENSYHLKRFISLLMINF